MIFNEVNVYEWLTFHQIHEQVSRYFSVLNNGILHFAETDAETAVVHYLTTFFPSASIPASFNLPVSTLESAVFSVLAFSKVPEGHSALGEDEECVFCMGSQMPKQDSAPGAQRGHTE